MAQGWRLPARLESWRRRRHVPFKAGPDPAQEGRRRLPWLIRRPERTLCLAMALLAAGCSTAAMDEPLNFAIACRTDTALQMAQRSAKADGVLDRALGQVAELAILKDAGRTTTYNRQRAALLAANKSMTQAQVDEAIDTKVAEMRAAREKATGQARC